MAAQEHATAAKAHGQPRGRGRTWIARGLVVGTLLVLACAPAVQPGGRPAEGKPGSAAVAAPAAAASAAAPAAPAASRRSV